MAGADLAFEVRIINGIDESYPDDMPAGRIAEFISKKKAAAYIASMADNELIVTADTVVVAKEKTDVGKEKTEAGKDMILGKPADADDARRMLRLLSGCTHQVITGVTLTTKDRQKSFSVATDVTFKQLSDEEIDYYIDRYKPFDKAGAYGIQEWIGYIGVTDIKGSYFNVMGLPIQRICDALKAF